MKISKSDQVCITCNSSSVNYAILKTKAFCSDICVQTYNNRPPETASKVKRHRTHQCKLCGNDFQCYDIKATVCEYCTQKQVVLCVCGCGLFTEVTRSAIASGRSFHQGHHSKGKSYLEIYGTSNPACGFGKGLNNPMSDPKTVKKLQDGRYKRKPFQLGDHEVSVQGYEPYALTYLINRGEEPSNIKIMGMSDMPVIRYQKNSQRLKCYYPDIYIANQNLLIEVKSTYTLGLKHKNLFEDVKSKFVASKTAGYDIEVWLFHLINSTMRKIDLPINWYLLDHHDFSMQMKDIMDLERKIRTTTC